jgi:hypothetical protein
MGARSRTVEEILGSLARGAHGIVTRVEMLHAGISRREIAGRLEKGLLITQYPGVYRVGHEAPSVLASYMAAVKACGEGAFLSGRAAAYLLGLIRGPVPRPEVTAPTERRVKGIKTRRASRESTKVRGIPVTTVPETLVDLAAEMRADELARACHEAGVKYRTTPRHVEAVLRRRPNATGRRKLQAVMRGETPASLSELERLAFELVRGARLPLPEMNRVASGRRVDLRWPGRLTAELQSYQFHNSRHSWERDHQRRREARRRGEEFRSYTWYDVTEGQTAMIAELRELLVALPDQAETGKRQ